MTEPSPTVKRVGLFVTCLVDAMRPNIGFAAVSLLEAAGCRVEVPPQQTCCGQPAYNSGDDKDAIRLAKQTIIALEDYDYVVAPSGSCAAMLKVHYPGLLRHDDAWHARAKKFAEKCFELTSFLVDQLGVKDAQADYHGTASYHDSCSGLRELGVKPQPRKLLENVSGLVLSEMDDAEVCCGFGGTFCVKYPDISEKMLDDKLANITASGADTVLGGDLGCLLNIAGRASRRGHDLKVYHVAEVLADMTDIPAIGKPGK
ncbi:MAG: (Fe-S)-binding protein [Gammaproteobacteria bacterium]|nr:(Fe-S)-binding protein [Gammaproteobacteria bacterium]